MLQRYWIKFKSSPAGSHGLGYGVTAYSQADALSILRELVYGGDALPELQEVIENVDIRSVDQKHVRPNMAPPVWRGVWYPLGYSPSHGR